MEVPELSELCSEASLFELKIRSTCFKRTVINVQQDSFGNKPQLRYNNKNFVIINKLTGFPYPNRIRVNTTSVTIIQLNIEFQFCGFRWHSLQSRLKLPQK